MKEWVKKGLEDFNKTGVCPYCGFIQDGIFRLHNFNDECQLMSNVNFRELFKEAETKTPNLSVEPLCEQE